MKKCFCDRCGAKFNGMSYVHRERVYQLKKYLSETDEYLGSFRVIDLCPACQKELEDWAKGAHHHEE